MIRVCLSGIGKTGKEIARYLIEQKDIKVVSAICSPDSTKKGKDLGQVIGCADTDILIESSDNIEQVVFRTRPDVVVDFSTPAAALKNAKAFSKMKVNIVIGTTGFSGFSLKKLFVLVNKNHNGIVYAPNITLGVNVLMLLTNLASNILNNYDFQITEIHHKHKKDSPSGTAVKIAGEIKKGLASSGRGDSKSHIPINSVRAGGVIGRHEVMIAGEDDKIEISHESFSRKAFAMGACRAVQFIHKRTGYYEMKDVLNLRDVLTDYVEKERTAAFKRKSRRIYYKMDVQGLIGK